jgi:hypothetical protein
MENQKENKSAKTRLAFGVVWLIGGILGTIIDSENIFFTLFLGLGIFFTTHTLKKNQILI